jgi:hypothetical protein
LNDITAGFEWLVWHGIVYGVPLLFVGALVYIVYLIFTDKKPTNKQ